MLIRSAQEKLHRGGDADGAKLLAQEALALDPNSAEAHVLLAQLATLRGDLAAAIPHWLQALADGRSQNIGLYLSAVPMEYMGKSRLRGFESLLKEISERHPDSQSRAEALAFLHKVQLRLGDLEGAGRTRRRRALISTWRGIGGFDNAESKGYDTPYGPELEIDLEKPYQGQRGTLRWRKIKTAGPGENAELDEFFFPFSWNVAYLLTYLKSPSDRELVLELTSTDPIKVWFNDRQVLATREVRQIRPRQFKIPITMRRGHNKLLIKTCQKKGSWRVSAWIADRAGRVLEFRAVPDPRPFTSDKRPPVPWSPSMVLPAGLKARSGSPRIDFWTAAALGAAGFVPSAITLLERHLMTHPKDPVALLDASIFQMAERHNQQASLLLKIGQRGKPPYTGAFWLRQVVLFRQRGQYDKAFAAHQKAQEQSPRSLNVARSLEKLLSVKGWQLDRCQLATRVRRKHPDWIWPLAVLANCNMRLGRYRHENAWLQAALEIAPAQEKLRNALVNSHLRLGRCHQAIAAQRQTTRLRPGRAGPFHKLAKVLVTCGKPDLAFRALDQASRRIPNWHSPYELKGKIRYEQGRREEAISLWNRALALNPDHVALWDRVTHLVPDRDPVLEEFRPTEAQIRQVLRRARKVRPVAGASIVWLMDHEVLKLMPDGTIKRVVTTVRKAVDRAGRDAMGQASLPRSGLVKVLEAYTLDRRGRRREVTSMHGRKVRYPTLHEGAVVVLQYRHIRRPGGYLRHHLATSWYFQHNLEQVVQGRWILATPPERKLSLHIQGDVAHKVERRHGVVIHTFSAKNVPPLKPERRSLPSRDLLRSVTVSTVPSWEYFSEWSNALTSEVFAVDPTMKRTLKRITASSRTVEDRIRKVYHFALTRIRYQQDYETFIAGVKPHTAASVLTRGYGDCKDKSVLIIAMLRHLGIKANLALIRVQRAGRVLPDVPFQQFNHAVVFLPPQPGMKDGRFLDATAENLDIDSLRPDVQGTLALILSPDGQRMRRVPYQDSSRNTHSNLVEVAMKPDGSAAVILTVEARGALAGALRKPLQNTQILRQYAQSMVHRLFQDCSLDDVDVRGHRTILSPLVVKLKATCASAARAEGNELRLRLPQIFSQVTSLARWSERRHPIFHGPPVFVRKELQLTLPAGMSIKSRPDDIEVSDRCLRVKGRWKKNLAGLRYSLDFESVCPVIPAKEYGTYRATVTRLKKHLEQEIVLPGKK